jgi:hypothetical protein
MTLNTSLEVVIHRHTRAATPLFADLIAQLATAQGPERLRLLNAVILSGPAYPVLHAVCPVPHAEEATLIAQEIAVVQRTLSGASPSTLDTLLDIDLANIVAPPVPLHEFPAAKWRVVLEASTECRRLAFSRVIRCLSTQPLCAEQVPHTPEGQRALTFAVFMLPARGLALAGTATSQEGWQPFTRVHDPIARVSGLLALQRAVQQRGLSPPMADTMRAAFETAWAA